MKTILREFISRTLNEIRLSDIENACYAPGSTHIMQTCSIGGQKYFLKFSDEELFDETDPSMQILVEYLAYKIYSLYGGVNIPRSIHLVADRERQKVGLATSEIKGSLAGMSKISPKELAKRLSAGVFVDIFLANWDVIGMGTGNIMLHGDKASRFDPGGALTFRAQGGRKGTKFGETPGELKTMLDPSFGGAGKIFQYADLRIAAKTFLTVSRDEILNQLATTNEEVLTELNENEMVNLAVAWKKEFSHIRNTLTKRYDTVVKHAQLFI